MEKPEQSPSLDALSMKIGELSPQVNRLNCVSREKSESSSSTDNIPNKDSVKRIFLGGW